jgi:hypothetical protein
MATMLMKKRSSMCIMATILASTPHLFRLDTSILRSSRVLAPHLVPGNLSASLNDIPMARDDPVPLERVDRCNLLLERAGMSAPF